METEPEAVFNLLAAEDRLEIIRKLTLEFAGVTLVETPIPNDFQSRVELTFANAGQRNEFMSRMFELHRQKSNLDQPGPSGG